MNKHNIVLIELFVLIIVFIISIIYGLFFHKDYYINNYKYYEEVNVNNDYDYQQIDLCYGNKIKCKKADYKVIGYVDTSSIGDYQVKYVFGNTYIKRIISVQDKEPPVVIVKEEIRMCPNGKIVNKAYEAHDNYDGDLTDKVELKKEDEQYYLDVKDKNGNKTHQVVNVVNYESVPKITLKGSNTINLKVNAKYTESGYTGTDECLGDITKDIKVTSDVNTSKAGTYHVTYTYGDVTVKRTVNVTSYSAPVNVPVSGNKIIYLTFDDGPGPYTKKLLGILDKYNVKATFFVTNQFSNSNYLKLIGEEARHGHTVCVHSYTHNYNIYKSVDAYFNDYNKMNNVILAQTGKKTNCLRFPGGSSNTVSRKYNKGIMTSLTREVTSKGYQYYDWNLSSGDAGGTTSASGVYNNVKRGLKGGTYNILMHDIKSYTVNAVEDIIKYGLANGYRFLPITSSSPTFHQKVNN